MIGISRVRVVGPISAAVLLLLFPVASANAEDSFLQNLAGNWTGTGAARQSEDSAPEPIKCKIAAEIDAAKQQLDQKGRCATADRTSSIIGEIKLDPENGRYSGHWSTRADGRKTELEGERIGDELHLSASTKTAGSIGTIVLAPNGTDGYVMVMSKTPGPDGKGGESAEIHFTRR